MANSDTDPVLFLSDASWGLVHMTRGLLEERGIPVLVQEPPGALGMVGLGHVGWEGSPGLAFPEVYVPRGALEAANQILEEALGASWRDKPHDMNSD